MAAMNEVLDSGSGGPAPPRKDTQSVQVIELHMMDKRKYFPLTLTSGFAIRALLYPFSLIKTRLQLQKHDAVYKGTFDAFRKILRLEGIRGLYKGFWVTNLFIVPQMSYISTYEGVRRLLADQNITHNNSVKSFIGGGCASLVGQTFVVPIDVVSQHIMMITDQKKAAAAAAAAARKVDGDSVVKARTSPSELAQMTRLRTPLNIPESALASPFGRSVAVVKAVYKQHGVRGFYKGYFVSLAVYAPNSAMWWFFYDVYCGLLSNVAPNWMSHLAIQTLAAPMSGVTSAFLTNPLDTVRARIQVEGNPFILSAKTLWQEERLGIFTKGLSARLVQSITFSFFIILCYESIKRISLLDEYKHDIRW